MKLELTRRGAYAIRAALTLARNRQGAVVPASRIAREMDIPVRFLPQILGDLTRAGIVEARLGRSGGYRLARPPADVSLLEIIRAAEGDARRRTCVLTGRSCGDVEPACDVHEVFFAAQGALLGRLARATLSGVLASADAGAPLAACATVPPRSQPSSWEPPTSS
ncbi:N/A [soil metagenome]